MYWAFAIRVAEALRRGESFHSPLIGDVGPGRRDGKPGYLVISVDGGSRWYQNHMRAAANWSERLNCAVNAMNSAARMGRLVNKIS